MKQTARKTTGKRAKPADKADDPRYLAKLVKDGHASDLDDAKHVAELVAKGMLSLGKGPIPPELLTPGPKAPNARKAIRWMMRGR